MQRQMAQFLPFISSLWKGEVLYLNSKCIWRSKGLVIYDISRLLQYRRGVNTNILLILSEVLQNPSLCSYLFFNYSIYWVILVDKIIQVPGVHFWSMFCILPYVRTTQSQIIFCPPIFDLLYTLLLPNPFPLVSITLLSVLVFQLYIPHMNKITQLSAFSDCHSAWDDIVRVHPCCHKWQYSILC